jgi:hypothetical protein
MRRGSGRLPRWRKCAGSGAGRFTSSRQAVRFTGPDITVTPLAASAPSGTCRARARRCCDDIAKVTRRGTADQETGGRRPRGLPSDIITSPAPDPTHPAEVLTRLARFGHDTSRRWSPFQTGMSLVAAGRMHGAAVGCCWRRQEVFSERGAGPPADRRARRTGRLTERRFATRPRFAIAGRDGQHQASFPAR